MAGPEAKYSKEQEVRKSRKWIKYGLILTAIALVLVSFFSNTVLQFFFPAKVFTHKTNTINALQNASKHFRGVELDIVFDTATGTFDVYHPPDTNLHLKLSDYFNSLSSKVELQYWLDFKNLNALNQKAALLRLNATVKEQQISTEQIIVESTAPQYLQPFAKVGYRTAYYLPAGLREWNGDFPELMVTIAREASTSPTTYLSADYRDYKVVNHHFPEKKKILWFNGYGEANHFEARYRLWWLLLMPDVEVLLVPAN